jgi:hypothetical protein
MHGPQNWRIYTQYLTFIGNEYLNTNAMISTFYTLGMNISNRVPTLPNQNDCIHRLLYERWNNNKSGRTYHEGHSQLNIGPTISGSGWHPYLTFGRSRIEISAKTCYPEWYFRYLPLSPQADARIVLEIRLIWYHKVSLIRTHTIQMKKIRPVLILGLLIVTPQKAPQQ